MAAQQGRAILLKISDGSSPAAFTTVGGFRTQGLTVNNETVDITNVDNAPWRQLQADTGVRSFTFTGSGVFTDSTTQNSVEDLVNNGNAQEFQIVFGNSDLYQGNFLVTSFEYAGEFNAEQTYSITLESSAVVTLIRA